MLIVSSKTNRVIDDPRLKDLRGTLKAQGERFIYELYLAGGIQLAIMGSNHCNLEARCGETCLRVCMQGDLHVMTFSRGPFGRSVIVIAQYRAADDEANHVIHLGTTGFCIRSLSCLPDEAPLMIADVLADPKVAERFEKVD